LSSDSLVSEVQLCFDWDGDSIFMMENVSAGTGMEQEWPIVLHMSNCYSLECCYTRFVVLLLFFKRSSKRLRLPCGAPKESICLLRLCCNVFVSQALAIWCLSRRSEAITSSGFTESQGSCLVSWLFINKLFSKTSIIG